MKPRRPTLAKQAYNEPEDQIVSGHLPAGKGLFPDVPANLLKVSQTPVKETLNRLKREGLVKRGSRRGSVVGRFKRGDMDQTYAARILPECNAAETAIAAGRVTIEFLDPIQRLHDDHTNAVARHTTEGLAGSFRRGRQFREFIVSLAENSLISGWYRIAIRQTQMIRTYSLARYDGRRLGGEHLAIIAGRSNRNGAAMLTALRFHLNASLEEFLSRLPEELPARQ